VLRSLIPGQVPLCLIDKPAPGTGASLLACVVGTIACGPADKRGREPWVTTALPAAKHELEKTLLAILREQPVLVLFDNVTTVISNPTLMAVLTSDHFALRELGRSELVHVEQRPTVIATGNQLQVDREAARRCIQIHLNAEMEHPENRSVEEFVYPNLLAYVAAHRGALRADIFTIGRAWLRAGRPKPVPSIPALGGFEGWRDALGVILTMLGVRDFLGNQAADNHHGGFVLRQRGNGMNRWRVVPENATPSRTTPSGGETAATRETWAAMRLHMSP